MSSSGIPAFTVLDDAIDNEPAARQFRNPEMPAWQSQYASNLTSAPPNSPLLEYAMPDMVQDYPEPELNSPFPRMPSSYPTSLWQNAAVSKRNMRFNLPATPPEPLPSQIEQPYVSPPYGMPYSSNGYSQFDGSIASDAGVSAFLGGPGVPAASWPAVQDARDSPSIPMTPMTLAFVVEKKYQEGIKDGKESFAQTYQPSCPQSIGHILNCPICNQYTSGHKKIYQWIIIGLVILCFILLILLSRAHS